MFNNGIGVSSAVIINIDETLFKDKMIYYQMTYGVMLWSQRSILNETYLTN